jgi:hypothetical protein
MGWRGTELECRAWKQINYLPQQSTQERTQESNHAMSKPRKPKTLPQRGKLYMDDTAGVWFHNGTFVPCYDLSAYTTVPDKEIHVMVGHEDLIITDYDGNILKEMQTR